MNKGLIRAGLAAALVLYAICVCARVWGQDDDVGSGIFMERINELLSEGECSRAQKAYEVWKKMAERRDASVESRIKACGQAPINALMERINAALSQGDCSSAQRDYNTWKEQSKKTDGSVESRIKACLQTPINALMERINAALSQGNCESAQRVYNAWKEMAKKTDGYVENRIKACRQSVVGEMVFVRGGSFTMGCTTEQSADCTGDEHPAHQVTLSDYYIGKYEVTQKQWKAVMGSDNNPSFFKGDNLPVENVSWDDTQKFINRLNEQTGGRYRLPTEAEWEYAARGGNQSRRYKYSGSNDVGEVAWYRDNSEGKTHPAGTKKGNELGIYDMSGNVNEWVSDWDNGYSSNEQTNPQGAPSGMKHLIRSGTAADPASNVRISKRFANPSGDRLNTFGFRIAGSSK